MDIKFADDDDDGNEKKYHQIFSSQKGQCKYDYITLKHE